MAVICSGNRCVQVPDQSQQNNSGWTPEAIQQQYGHIPGFQLLPDNYKVRGGQTRPHFLINGQPQFISGQRAPAPTAIPQSDPRGHSTEEAMNIDRARTEGLANQARQESEKYGQSDGPFFPFFNTSTQPPEPVQPSTLAQKVQGFDQQSSPDSDWNNFEKYYTNKFYKETVPALTNRYAGALGGSDYQGSLGTAGAGLSENLAALRLEHNRALRDQMIRMQALNRNNQQPGGNPTPTWYDTAANVIQPLVAEAAGLIPGVGPFARAGVQGIGSYFRNNVSAQPNQESYSGVGNEPSSGQSNLLNSRVRSGYVTPEDVQRFQATTGLGGSAAADFANTFRQPGSSSSMFNKNVNKFNKFINASPGNALATLGIRS